MSSIEENRAHHLRQWQSAGFNYPSFARSHDCANLQETYEQQSAEDLTSQNISVRVAGRIVSKRKMGKVCFWDMDDGQGNMQLFLRDGTTSDFEMLQSIDTGDIVGACGTLMRTKTGELSVRCQSVVLLSKNLEILPISWDGLTDVETRYRKRYVDLAVNADSRARFVARSLIVRSIRQHLDSAQFLEVETPMMQVLHGGANARPFETHHEALDMGLYMRVAPELYLKRCVVGGMTRVYELNRNFRNEGVSTRHNPEFTMLEVYEAYTTYNDMMSLCQSLIQEASRTSLGSQHIQWGPHSIDLNDFRRERMDVLVSQTFGVDVGCLRNEESMAELLAGHNLTSTGSLGGDLVVLFEHGVEGSLVQPTFVTHYPIEVSPLARRNDEEPHLTDRFELFIGGMEMANGFSELNDPFDQEQRMREQALMHRSGESEAMLFDADYINALRVGLPPCGGLGLGIDRLVMMLTNTQSIRDVLLFPLMRPRPLEEE